MLNVKTEEVLFEGQVDENAQIIASYPMSHENAIEILTVVVKLKSDGISNENIISRLTRR
ncbi:hypothetical protein [Brevibacillus porteri]|uniref:hypothetical protein n=1 Tax=Brevibacillus porteri TaxID=2126350 RepID=UPI00362CDA6D